MPQNTIPTDTRTRLRAWTLATMICSAVLISSCATPGTSAPPTVEESQPDLVFPPPPEQSRFVFERTILGSADVVTEDSDTRWRRVLTGEAKHSTGFSKPFDVEACQGRIYVSDTVRRSILLFDVPNGTFSEFGTTEPGELRKPLGMATCTWLTGRPGASSSTIRTAIS